MGTPARDAVARGAWQEAYDLLVAAEAAGDLDPDELPLLGEVSYAAGDLDRAIQSWERAYAAYLEADDEVNAAAAAARVAMHLLFDTALMAPVRGWLRRAEVLLEDREDTPAHAWYAVVRSYERMLSGDLAGAAPWAQRAIDVGSNHDSAACALGRVVAARLMTLDGQFQEGLELLNEVGVAAVSGDLDPLSTGVAYCELVCALQGLGQYDAAEQWTEAMERWCRTNAIGSLHGRCRVHRAEILRLRGKLGEAETEILTACDELRPYLRRELGWPLNELGQVHLHRGDLEGAEQALLAAHHAGWDPQPMLARVRLGHGDVEAAATSIREALEHPLRVPSKERPPDSGLQRAPLLEAEVEIAVAAGELDRARAAVDELEAITDRLPSRAIVAGAALARGRLRLAEGAPADAIRHFARACGIWSEIDAPYEVAVCRRALAEAHRKAGDEQQAALELGASEEILDRLSEGGPSQTPQQTAGTDAFRQEGDYWSLGFDDHTVRIRDLKGMHYLARLLAEPGREFHALDLVAAETGGLEGRLGDAGELLDDEAKAAYRRRLDEIEADLEEAHALGDAEREAQAQMERDFLVRELSRAFGLGGRRRRSGSASERARVAVTRAVRTAMARISDHHATLGEHLDRTIQTGTYCSYQPDPRVPVRWDV